MNGIRSHRASLLKRFGGRFSMPGLLLILPVVLCLIGCGSGKVSVEGYDQAALNNKRVFVLLPSPEQMNLAQPATFAASRGIGEAGASGRIATEFRTDLPSSLDARLDSNTFLDYSSQTVGAVVPLDPVSDLPKGSQTSWNWDKVRDAAKQGNIDYLLVLHSVRVENEAPKEGASRGNEKVSVSFSLIDPLKQKVLTANDVSVEIKDPRKPADTYTRLADMLAKKLPFNTYQ